MPDLPIRKPPQQLTERPNAWPYRDYVIRSFNEDRPYNQFIMEQIAGDEINPEDPEMLLQEIERRRLERKALSNRLQRRSWALPREKHHPRNRDKR